MQPRRKLKFCAEGSSMDRSSAGSTGRLQSRVSRRRSECSSRGCQFRFAAISPAQTAENRSGFKPPRRARVPRFIVFHLRCLSIGGADPGLYSGRNWKLAANRLESHPGLSRFVWAQNGDNFKLDSNQETDILACCTSTYKDESYSIDWLV
jgi:hypothetical protein